MKKRKKIGIAIVGVISLLVILRILLPDFTKWYLNNRVLTELTSYTGRVGDVDMMLWRGAYCIDSLVIWKKDSDLSEPFIVAASTDLSIQWKALFDGEIVSEIESSGVHVHFAFNKDDDKSQTGTEEDWIEVVKEFTPVRINSFRIRDGSVAFSNVFAEPRTDIPVENFRLSISNIQNTLEADVDSLPSYIAASGTLEGYKGQMHLTADAYLLKEVPDFDYQLQVENIDLPSLNPLAQHYLKFDFERGDLSVFSEVAMKDSAYAGYIKPLVKDMRIFNWKEEGRPIGQWFREFFGEGIQEIFENQKRQQFATKIPVEGRVEDFEAGIWPAIANAFINAYIEAFEYQLDDTIDFEDVYDAGSR